MLGIKKPTGISSNSVIKSPGDTATQDSINPTPNTDLDLTKLHEPSYGFLNPSKAANFGFTKIDNSFDFTDNPEIKKILNKFNITESSSNKALIDKERTRLMIVTDGPTAFRELFNNSWSNLLFGWIRRVFGKTCRNYVTDWQREGLKFSTSKSDPQAKILEPMSHIRRALRLDHYKAVTMFYIDKETNKFKKEPEAISLITQYEPLLDEVIKSAPDDQVKAAEKIKSDNSFKDWYCTDQYIVNPRSDLDLSEITHNTCEAFFVGHGFKGLTVHYKVHEEDNATSSDLSYDSIPWKHLYERNNGTWKSSDDNNPKSKITVVRSKSSRYNPIPKELAYMHAWAQMALGRSFEESEDNLDLVNSVEQTNSSRIGEFNQVISLNLPKTEKS